MDEGIFSQTISRSDNKSSSDAIANLERRIFGLFRNFDDNSLKPQLK
jgi:hypothetical protein